MNVLLFHKTSEYGKEDWIVDIVDDNGEGWVKNPCYIVPSVLIHNGFLIGNGIRAGTASPSAVTCSHNSSAVVAAEHVVGYEDCKCSH